MIRFACACGRQLQARDDLAGKVATCPGCGERVPIPGPGAVRGDEPPPRRPGAVRAERADDEFDERPRRRPREEEDEGRPAPARTSGKATGSLLLGISSFVCLLNVLTGLPAVILGLLALRDIGRSRGRLGGQGLAIGGIVGGVLGVLVALPAIVVSVA